MVIIYYDGSRLETSEIEFTENAIIASGIYEIPLAEVLRIVEE